MRESELQIKGEHMDSNNLKPLVRGAYDIQKLRIQTSNRIVANFKAKLPADEHRDIVDLLYYARNAFVHCAWDISKLDSENQKTKLRNFAGGGETCSFCSVFSMSLNGDRLKVKGVQNIGHILNKAVENAGSE